MGVIPVWIHLISPRGSGERDGYLGAVRAVCLGVDNDRELGVLLLHCVHLEYTKPRFKASTSFVELMLISQYNYYSDMGI